MKRTTCFFLMMVGTIVYGAENLKSSVAVPEKPLPAYKLQYQELKKSLGINDKNLSAVEVLEVIALRYAEMFDKTQENFTSLDKRVVQLEQDNAMLKSELAMTAQRVTTLEKDVKALQETTRTHAADIDKLYDWANKVDDELFNGVSIGVIGGLRQEVKKNMQNIGDNASDIQKLQAEIQRQRQAINNLSWAIQNIR